MIGLYNTQDHLNLFSFSSFQASSYEFQRRYDFDFNKVNYYFVHLITSKWYEDILMHKMYIVYVYHPLLAIP